MAPGVTRVYRARPAGSKVAPTCLFKMAKVELHVINTFTFSYSFTFA